MWVVGGCSGKDAGYCEDANLMHPTSLLGREMRAGLHTDPLLQQTSFNLCRIGAVTSLCIMIHLLIPSNQALIRFYS